MIVALVLVLAGAVVLFWTGRRRRSAGLPSGRVVYMDMGPADSSTPLFDPAAQLTGRPDYLVETDGSRVPVEVKSARAPVIPYQGHVLQLAAYCYLTEVVFGVRPTHGVLRYQDRAVAVDYTAELENEMLDVLAQMRRQQALELDRSHASVNRCRSCGYRDECDQSLV